MRTSGRLKAIRNVPRILGTVICDVLEVEAGNVLPCVTVEYFRYGPRRHCQTLFSPYPGANAGARLPLGIRLLLLYRDLIPGEGICEKDFYKGAVWTVPIWEVLRPLLWVAACIPPAPATPPVVNGNFAPTIASFKTAVAPGTSPALVTLTWNVDDANGDDVTCAIDLDGDGSPEITVDVCQGRGSRNVTLSAIDGVSTTHKLTLSVTDGLVIDGVLRSVIRKLNITIAPGLGEPFDITLIGVDSLSSDVAAAFNAAASKWERVITTGLPDIDGAKHSVALRTKVGRYRHPSMTSPSTPRSCRLTVSAESSLRPDPPAWSGPQNSAWWGLCSSTWPTWRN